MILNRNNTLQTSLYKLNCPHFVFRRTWNRIRKSLASNYLHFHFSGECYLKIRAQSLSPGILEEIGNKLKNGQISFCFPSFPFTCFWNWWLAVVVCILRGLLVNTTCCGRCSSKHIIPSQIDEIIKKYLVTFLQFITILYCKH